MHITSPGLRADELPEITSLRDYIAFNLLPQWARYSGEASRSAGCGPRVNPQFSKCHQLAALEQGIPVVAVRENKNLMRNDLAVLPWADGQLIVVENYWEAAGVVASLRAGIAPESVRRPLSWTTVRETSLEGTAGSTSGARLRGLESPAVTRGVVERRRARAEDRRRDGCAALP